MFRSVVTGFIGFQILFLIAVTVFGFEYAFFCLSDVFCFALWSRTSCVLSGICFLSSRCSLFRSAVFGLIGISFSLSYFFFWFHTITLCGHGLD